MENNCPKFDYCDAPLCPLDEGIKERIWYPDEEICNSQYAKGLKWVTNQRKVAKMATDETTYFTVRMLQHACIIRKGIRGLNPDKEEVLQLKKWFKEHPAKKEIPEDRRKKLQEQMAGVRAKKK